MQYLHLEPLLHTLQDLLNRLRRDKYAVDMADFIAARALLLRLLEQNELFVSASTASDVVLQQEAEQRLQGMLSALLCRNPREQAQFPQHFQAWLVEQREEWVTESMPEVATLSASDTPRPRRTGLLLIVLLVLGVGSFFGYGWFTQKTDESSSTNTETTQPEVNPTSELISPEPELISIAQIWLLLLLLIPLLLWLIQLLNRRYLRRRLSAAASKFAELKLKLSKPQLYQSVALGNTLQQLRRHEIVSSDTQLDVAATLEQSILNWGLFTPVSALVQRRPEYLVLVDRAAPDDQQTALVDSFLARLNTEDVAFERWYFEQDPRWCYASATDFTPHLLTDLAARYAGWRLLIFASGHHFIDALSGRPAPWLQQLTSWSQRVLLTLEPPNRWRYLQKLLVAEGLLVAPADEMGLDDFIVGLQRERLVVREYQVKLSKLYPALLVRDSERWLQRIAPAKREIKQLLEQLHTFLDPDGLRWLAACAVYPELHWRLTLYLGAQLKVVDEARLARLTSLPWLRYGYMPDWLRSALLDGLSWGERKRIRGFFQPILCGELLDGEVETSIFDTTWGRKSKYFRDRVFVSFWGGKLGFSLQKLTHFPLLNSLKNKIKSFYSTSSIIASFKYIVILCSVLIISQNKTVDDSIQNSPSQPQIIFPASQIREPLHIFFEAGQNTLSPQSQTTLLNLNVYILEHKYDIKFIRIIGYTDNQGSEEFNLHLAETRARVVGDFLKRGGVITPLLYYEVGGQIDSNNDTEKERAWNRRATIVIEWR